MSAQEKEIFRVDETETENNTLILKSCTTVTKVDCMRCSRRGQFQNCPKESHQISACHFDICGQCNGWGFVYQLLERK